jgi:hypothetical protein
MMYGNPEGAAFGITPMIGKRREDRQDREAAKSFPVDLARGVVAGAAGMPGDIESLIRMLPGLDERTILPTSEDVLKRIPFGTDTPAGQFASGLGTLAGGSAPFGAIPRAVKAAPGALKTAARNVSAPRTLNPQAGVVRVGQPSAPQMEALRLAQKRAALPIEQGGLGLPANNTPEQRAAAMGFDRDTYHGSLRDIKKLDPRLGSTESHAGRGVYSTDSPEDASLNYASIYGPDVSGRVERGLEERDKDFRKIYGRMRDEVLTPRQQEIILRNAAGADNLGVVYPLRVRSDKSIHLDAPESNPVLVGPFEQYDEATGTYIDTPLTEKFREALDEFGELGGEANPIYEVVQDGDGPVPARDVFNAVKKTGNETGLYDPYTGDIVSGGVAAGDFVKHFGIDEIRHTPEFRNQQLNIGNEHTISLNPDNVRSRFAAFDPFRKDVATAAAMGVLAPDLLAKEKDEDKKKDKDKGTKKAQGGRVHFSDNPDVMQLELAAGGLVKGLKAAAKAVKEPAQAPMKASEALGRIEGRPLVITQSDRTKVGGGFLGGPGFSSLQLTEPEYRAAEAVWGVKTPGVAKMILGGGKKAGPDPVYTTFIGTPNQHQSNQMVFDKLYGDFKKSAKKGGLEPELQEKINYRLANAVDKDGRPIFPPDVNILDKNFKDLATTFDQRAVTSSLIGGLGVGGKKGQIVDYDKIIRNTTDPALLDAPSGALGNRLFTLSGGIIDRPDLHPAFPTILQGEDMGVSFDPVVRDLVMKDFIEKTMREKGRTPGYMDYTRGHPPSQLITEDILTEMQKLGLKKGGAVRKAAGGEITADDLILEERKL